MRVGIACGIALGCPRRGWVVGQLAPPPGFEPGTCGLEVSRGNSPANRASRCRAESDEAALPAGQVNESSGHARTTTDLGILPRSALLPSARRGLHHAG